MKQSDKRVIESAYIVCLSIIAGGVLTVAAVAFELIAR